MPMTDNTIRTCEPILNISADQDPKAYKKLENDTKKLE